VREFCDGSDTGRNETASIESDFSASLTRIAVVILGSLEVFEQPRLWIGRDIVGGQSQE
jgi:hypothetical protein